MQKSQLPDHGQPAKVVGNKLQVEEQDLQVNCNQTKFYKRQNTILTWFLVLKIKLTRLQNGPTEKFPYLNQKSSLLANQTLVTKQQNQVLATILQQILDTFINLPIGVVLAIVNIVEKGNARHDGQTLQMSYPTKAIESKKVQAEDLFQPSLWWPESIATEQKQ